MSNKEKAKAFLRAHEVPEDATHIAVSKGGMGAFCKDVHGVFVPPGDKDGFYTSGNEFFRISELTSGVTAEEKDAVSSGFNDVEETRCGYMEIIPGSFRPVFNDELMEAFDHYDGFDEFASESAIMESKDKAFSIALKLYREMKK